MMSLNIFMACHMKPNNRPYAYITPIQVGAANASEVFLQLTDHKGENISAKNNIYCELTAFFWMWKNCDSENLGLCHYRRFFSIEENEIHKLLNQGKVIVPKRAMLGRSIEKQYKYNHSKEIWDSMIEVLKQKDHEMYLFSKKVFSRNLLYPFNMVIAKRDFMEEYSEWLFDILFKVEKRVIDTELDPYQLRYTGFLAERLFTLYLLYHQTDIYECDLIDDHRKRISPSVFHTMRNNIYYIILGGIT